MLTKPCKYLRYGCENTHISAVCLSHRAAVYKSIPASLMNIAENCQDLAHERVGIWILVQWCRMLFV